MGLGLFKLRGYVDLDLFKTKGVKYIYLFQILYSMKSVFLLKYTLRFFIFKFGINLKHRFYFFPLRTMVYRKKNFIEKIVLYVDYVKIIELHVVHT